MELAASHLAAPATTRHWRVPLDTTAETARAAARLRAQPRAMAVPRALRLVTFVAWLGAVAWSAHAGLMRAYGDALSHELIARRVLDSLHPGIGQLGTVWLPLPPLLLALPVHVDALWHSGFAGALLGGIFLQLSIAALYRTGALLGGAAMGWVAALAFLAAPNTLYLYTTPLLEAVALSFTCLAVAAAARVLAALPRKDTQPDALVAAGFFAACGILSRYDNWMTAALIGAVIVAMAAWYLRDRMAIQAVAICYALLPLCAICLWLIYNAAIFDDPLAFLRGEYSSAGIVADLAANGIIPTVHGHPPEQGAPVRALLTYLTAVVEVSGVVPLALAALGAVWAAARWRRPTALLYLMLLGPLFFYIVALTTSQSVIVTRAAQPDGLFNIRYGVQLAPFVALAAAALVTLPGRMARFAGIAVVALVLTSGVAQFFEPLGPVVVAEGRLQDRAADAQGSYDAARWLIAHPADGLTLMDDALQPQSKIVYTGSGRPLRGYVDSSTPAEWAQALAAPPPAITRIITLSPHSRQHHNDRVAGALMREGQIPGFVPVFENGEIVVFQRAGTG